jgi:hypothetical protein
MTVAEEDKRTHTGRNDTVLTRPATLPIRGAQYDSVRPSQRRLETNQDPLRKEFGIERQPPCVLTQ